MKEIDKLYSQIENLESMVDTRNQIISRHEEKINFLQVELSKDKKRLDLLAKENKKLKTDNERFILRGNYEE